MKLFYAGYQPEASGFGWATANRYLVRELSKLCEVVTDATPKIYGRGHWETWCHYAAPVFMPLADHDLNPASKARAGLGHPNLAYTFFESELGPRAAENAAKYDVAFCGSTWCLERMKERGITNGRVLIQGVDHSIFRPIDVPRADKSFRIFSGGKFEYRKGQDIVIAAVRELVKKHPNVKLVTAWHNPWPLLIEAMFHEEGRRTGRLKAPRMLPAPQDKFYRALLEANGIPPENFEVHGPLSQPELAAVMNSTDLGVFPNRCEGGTNLVLMEYMACGKPVVATFGTGHQDVWDYHQCIPVFGLQTDQKWIEAEPEFVAKAIEENMDAHWPKSADEIKQFTWERAARQIVDTVKELSA